MPGDINKRIAQLRARRIGIDRISLLDERARTEALAKSLYGETWDKRTSSRPNTNYIAGAMAEVDAQYTSISITTAERVGKQLNAGLTRAGLTVDFRLQGSVPLNVHIRSVSDVDLLGPVHSSRFVFTFWNLDVSDGSTNVERWAMVAN